jgi:hypothetical protein
LPHPEDTSACNAPEHVALELVAENIALNLLAHAHAVQVGKLLLVIDVVHLHGGRAGVGDVELQAKRFSAKTPSRRGPLRRRHKHPAMSLVVM